jgi:type IV secretory pathway VirB10-like protein
MTEENQQNFGTEDEDSDVTLVAPRFDEAAAVTARPVEPLAENGLHDRLTVGPAPAYAPRPVRRSWVVALVLVSALVGSMLGGIGLRFYQKRQRVAAAAQNVAPVETTPAPVETTPAQEEVSATTTDEARETPIAKAQPPVILEETEATTPAPPVERVVRENETRKSEETKRRAEEASDERRKSEEDNDRRAEERRGERKKGKRGDSVDDNDGERGEPRARRVGVITARESVEPRRSERTRDEYEFYRPRRERPRSEPQSRDRVRAIFEGQPPR